uniref:Uncharacterized protein n=1 Tax=Plectus sambesii TaxID=2011161 RepID=A0A914X7T8_9BILA
MPLMVRYSKTRTVKLDYLSTSSVFVMDAIRLISCSTILMMKYGSLKSFVNELNIALFGNLRETFKVCVPALIYAVQNNLYYIALANLEAAAYSITYQLRTLTTAILSTIMLGKQISTMQWGSLVMSVVGVAAVHYEQNHNSTDDDRMGNRMIGFAAVIAICWTSAFAGVYFEKVLKGSSTDIWMQNIRLSMIQLPISGIAMCYNDWDRVAEGGIFQGWDWLVWTITISAALGGFLVSAVMKYADNIQKTFAQSVAIVLTAIGSAAFLDFAPTPLSFFGMTSVLISVYVYYAFPVRTEPDSKLNANDINQTDDVAIKTNIDL